MSIVDRFKQDEPAVGDESIAAVSIDRTVVMLATAGAGLFFMLLSVTWLIGGDSQFGLQALTPLAVTAVGVTMLLRDRPQPVLQLAVAAVGLISYVTVADPELPGDPLLGLFVMAVAGGALLRHHVVPFIAGASFVLGAAAYAWAPATYTAGNRAVLAFSAAVSFVIISWLVAYLQRQARSDRQRLRALVASKDQFVATVSHELRTPLTVVVGLAHELHHRHAAFTPQEWEEFTALLVSESSDVAGIVEDLLVAARADLGSLVLDARPVDVGPVVESTMNELLPGQTLSSSGDRRWVLADQLRLRQIIRNLVVNAQRYGGEDVRLAVHSDADGITVEVRDNGPALDVSDSSRIFDAYHRAASIEGKPGSVGLGLTVSRQLARLMGGDVTCEHDGHETIFSLRLPWMESESVPHAA